MAVTQQIVRFDQSKLAIYGSNLSAVEELVNFNSEPINHYEDLDWSPGGLVEGIKDILGSAVANIIKSLLSGDAILLNSEYCSNLGTNDVYSELTVLKHEEYCSVVPALFSVSSVSIARAIKSNSSRPDVLENLDPINYYSENYRLLCDFLNAAGNENQAIAAWWD